MSARPATALEIAMKIVALAVGTPRSRAAYLRSENVASIANDLFQAGGIRINADDEVIENKIGRLHVNKVYRFLNPTPNNEPNVLAISQLEFETIGLLVAIRRKPHGKSGTRYE